MYEELFFPFAFLVQKTGKIFKYFNWDEGVNVLPTDYIDAWSTITFNNKYFKEKEII